MSRIRTISTVSLLAGLSLLAACAAPGPQLASNVPPPWLKDIPVAPLEILEYRAAQGEGDHALFLRLSRFPDRLTYQPVEEPPELVLRMEGPAVGEDVAEERVIVPDALITALRVSRTSGTLTVVVEFAAAELPEFRIAEAADWITVRAAPRR